MLTTNSGSPATGTAGAKNSTPRVALDNAMARLE